MARAAAGVICGECGPCGPVTWAPAIAGVTFVERDARPTGVIPAEAGTQATSQQRCVSLEWRARLRAWSAGNVAHTAR